MPAKNHCHDNKYEPKGNQFETVILSICLEPDVHWTLNEASKTMVPHGKAPSLMANARLTAAAPATTATAGHHPSPAWVSTVADNDTLASVDMASIPPTRRGAAAAA